MKLQTFKILYRYKYKILRYLTELLLYHVLELYINIYRCNRELYFIYMMVTGHC
jgi:hypothetical protein